MKLVKLEGAQRALAEAKTLDEIQQIMDNAVAFQAYAKAAKMGIEMQNDVAELKIRAERKAGEFLRDAPKAKNQHGGGNTLLPATLKELDVEKMEINHPLIQEMFTKFENGKYWKIMN